MIPDAAPIAGADRPGADPGGWRHGAFDARRLTGRTAPEAVNFGAVLLLIAAAFAVVMVPNGTLFGGSFIVDDFARFLKILTLLGSAFAIVMSLDYMAAEKQEKFEYSVLIVLSTVGMGMLISAGDLIALYLGLETDKYRALRRCGFEP